MSVRPDDPEYPYLVVNRPQLLKDLSTIPYDAKKSCFIPDEQQGYATGMIQSTQGEQVTVKTDKGDVRTVKADQVNERNPYKYELAEDMADMSYLSEASVLHNLRQRYERLMIYTYSGLFCVVINPYKRLPIYDDVVVTKYRGKRRGELPPHLFAIADNAFSNMLVDRENQSVLITGESGAGKTENTKKVIMFFAKIAAAQAKAEGIVLDTSKGSLEEQIVGCNPPLEAYGNAKTVRNNNSSRFGKFIRIHFGPTGKIAGADIEHYLLEKSRVVHQMKIERNYHIFYQLLSSAKPELHEKLLVDPDPSKYDFINQGVLTVQGIDDVVEMNDMDTSLTTLGFSDEEKFDMYRVTSGIMQIGQMKFKGGKDDTADSDGTAEAEKVAHLFGVAAADLISNLIKPKVKVGNDWVTKSQTLEQVKYACNTVAKSVYARMFDKLVAKCNESLDTQQARKYFIGVLDIAGFEIFEVNSFDQLCINFTNERLQQFFNHHMFVLEQEEYKKEGIVWEFIDFGMDLQACIELIEKPLGIFSILEEECMFPKASDKTFVEKLQQNHIGKNPAMSKPKPQKIAGLPENHFVLKHYAGNVAYCCFFWLERNKDPINTCIVELLGQAKVPLIAKCYYVAPEPAGGGGGKKKKGGSMQTISGAHRESLNKLMKNLYSTHPHFVRCLIPNEVKTPALIDAHLVMHQLQCNGVLEGIRICRKGFPNRMLYPDFKQRYTILAPNAVPPGFIDAKVVAEKVLPELNLGEMQYMIGHTKVFFRAGVLGRLEEIREDKISDILKYFQAYARGYLNRRQFKKLQDQRTALSLIQRNIRKYVACKDWAWWKFYCMIKPLLSELASEDETKKMEEEFENTKKELTRNEDLVKELQAQNVKLSREKEDYKSQVDMAGDSTSELEERIENMVQQRIENEALLAEFERRIQDEESKGGNLAAQKSQLQTQVEGFKNDVADLEAKNVKSEQDRSIKDSTIRKMQDEMAQQDQGIAKLQKEKKAAEEKGKKLGEDLAAEEDKVSQLQKIKQKLEGTLDEMEENLNREKKVRGDVEKVKRKVEGDLRMTQDACAELERLKKDLEDGLRKKDGELVALNGKVEEDQTVIAGLQKKIKDLQRKITELEEEVETERQNRTKAEKSRADLQMELDEVSQRADEATGATQAALELSKRRDQEVAKMRSDMDEAHMMAEGQLSQLKKKMSDQVHELSEQVDSLSKAKTRAEKERNSAKAEIDDLSAQLDSVARAKGNAEKSAKMLDAQVHDLSGRLDDESRKATEGQQTSQRLHADQANLQSQLDEAESQVGQLTKAKNSLAGQVEEARRTAEEEARGRSKALGELRNIQSDVDRMRDSVEEEQEAKSVVARQLAKANGELAALRSKVASGDVGGEGMSDEQRRRIQAKMLEAEQQVEAALAKAASLEKMKHKLQAEVEDLAIEVERSTSIASQAEKKSRQVDKIVADYQHKLSTMQSELETASRDSRAFSAEVFRLKAQLEEGHDVQEGLRRENKNLSGELRDLMDQLSEGGKSVHEIEKARRRLEVEKAELQAALEEAEAALEAEEAKVQRAQLDIAQAHQDLDKRMSEKDEEMDMFRKNHQRALDSVNATCEAEARAKSEAQRVKQKLQNDVGDLEVQLDGANRSRAEMEKAVKRFQQQLMDMQRQHEEDSRARDELREAASNAERRAAGMAAELEEYRNACENAERGRKAVESEAREAVERVNELSVQNSSLQAAKRKYEADLQAMSSDLDDAINELKAAEDRSKKAAADAARITDELRHEQEHSNQIDRIRRNGESQIKELQMRVDEAEAAALKGGKRQIAKLEQRSREVEGELDAEQRAHQETGKGARKAEQRLRELVFQVEEDRKNQERLTAAVEGLQGKLKLYKRQVEEAEELAAINLAKYRKVQTELEEVAQRADQAEGALAKTRADRRSVSRSGSVVRK